MSRHILLVIASLLIGGTNGAAQVEVYSNQANKADSVISFGATRPRPPVGIFRTIWVRNTSSVDIGIKPSITDVMGQQSAVVNEFAGLFGNEIVPAGQTKQFKIVYKADYDAFEKDVLAQVRFNIDIEEASTQRFVFRRSFVLTGLKTDKLLGTDTKTISFDSVFVTPDCSSRSAVTVYSVTDTTVVVREQRIRRVTPYLGTDEFDVETYPTVEFPGISSLSWNCSYRPVDAGFDAIDFLLLYRNQNNGSDTSAVIRMQGIGVRQDFVPVGVKAIDGSAATHVIRRDTLYLGDVPDTHDSLVVALAIQNKGSISVGIDSLVIGRNQQSAARFTIQKTLPRSMTLNSLDTVKFVFVPDATRSSASAVLRIYTNLGRRAISCVPASAIVREIVIIAKNRPAVRASIDELTFGSIVKPAGCDVQRVQRFSIRNNGVASCTIDSVTFDPVGGSVAVSRAAGTVVAANSAVLIDATFTPTLIGTERGSVTFWLSNQQGAMVLPYSASVIDPDTVVLRVDATYRSAPGSRIRMPVRFHAVSPTSVQRVTLDLEMNPTILSYSRVIQTGTASEGALVVPEPKQRGVRLNLRNDAGFGAGDTLIEIEFETYLGDTVSTPVVLTSSSSVGTAFCESVFPLMMQHGMYSTDSLCGLSYKTRGASTMLRGSVFPNPASSFSTIVVLSDKAESANFTVVDAYGRTYMSYASVVNEGLSAIPFNVSPLPSGQYVVVVERGGFCVRIPCVVSQ